jgi:hypothetical protein
MPGNAAGSASGRLADYLEQHGRRARRPRIPPAGFWTAAARFAHLGDLPALASAAGVRGLYRDAARLRKHAATRGTSAKQSLSSGGGTRDTRTHLTRTRHGDPPDLGLADA